MFGTLEQLEIRDQLPAFERNDAAGHQIGAGDDVDDRRRDVFRLAYLAQDHALLASLLRLIINLFAQAFLQPARSDEARRDGVDAHLRREDAGELDVHVVESRFRRAIGYGTADAGQPKNARNVDDLSVAGSHQRVFG